MNDSSFDIQALLRPDAYSHEVTNPSLVETHVSWVVLTGPFAYKIKKAVELDFLDTTDLAHRRFLCEEELRLNQRFAADLYVDVVPITCADGQLTIDGDGVPVEYAVRMRQFDPSEELLSLLPGTVTPAEIRELAHSIATFHSQAAAAPWAGVPTRTRNITHTVLDNLSSIRARLEPSSAAMRSIDRSASYLQAFLGDNESLLIQRERTGFIRECHGDLHARNVVRYKGRLVPFDCLEFDPNLRWIDICDDIAFLAMDLACRERADLALTLLSAYLEAGGDYAGLRLFGFYATHRALVRAKVDLLSAQSVASQEAPFLARFERRLQAARKWSTQRQGMIVLMHGLSGSGKSWLSERLVTALPGLRIRSDVERKRLAGIAPHSSAASDIGDGIYSPDFDRRTYARLLEYAEIGVAAGFTMIIDATFLDGERRTPFFALARRLNAPCYIVSCVAPRSVLEERILARERSADRTSDADLSVLTSQLCAIAPFTAAELDQLVTADTSTPQVVASVASAIRAPIDDRFTSR